MRIWDASDAHIVLGARSTGQSYGGALLVVDESLGSLAASLEPAEAMHFLVAGIKLRGLLTRMRKAGGAQTVRHELSR